MKADFEKGMKICSRCKKKLSLDCFRKNKSSNDGLENYCKKCKSEFNRSESGKRIQRKQTIRRRVLGYAKEDDRKRREKVKNNLNLNLTQILRSRCYNALKCKNNRKSTHTLDLLGCSIEHLKRHLESQFKEGMSWDNYGKWHVDHIIPCSYFDLTKEENQRICFNYRNLQPLWAKENDSKGAKVPNNVEKLVEFLKKEIFEEKYLSEIFKSIQGEGRYAGIPSLFIRTIGCNLRCRWCDTSFTSWKPEKGSYSNLDVKNLIKENPLIRHIVLSGGEPCISNRIEELIIIAKNNKKLITLETNGIVCLDESLMKMIDLVSISPKLRDSTPIGTKYENIHEKNRIRIDNFKKWMKYAQNYQLKFVVSKREDFEEIENLLKELKPKKGSVCLMPEGINEEQLLKKRQMVAEYCAEHGYHYSDRLQIIIWGTKRGV